MEVTQRMKDIREIVKACIPDHPYHNITHAQDVAETAVIIGRREGLDAQGLELMWLKGFLHDSIFNLGASTGQNEQITAEKSREIMISKGYTTEQAEEVYQDVLETTHPHPEEPKTLTGRIIRDADVANIGRIKGRNNFWEKSQLVYKEINLVMDKTGKPPLSEATWARARLAFLDSKSFYTTSAKELYGKGLQANRVIAQRIVSAYEAA